MRRDIPSFFDFDGSMILGVKMTGLRVSYRFRRNKIPTHLKTVRGHGGSGESAGTASACGEDGKSGELHGWFMLQLCRSETMRRSGMENLLSNPRQHVFVGRPGRNLQLA